MNAYCAPRVYDAIRLARPRCAEGIIAVLACYLDDSDASISKVETIAGYVAHEDGWKRFEESIDAICLLENVELIRGRQLDGRMDCFDGWSLLKTEKFLDKIGRAMVGNVLFGISRSIGKENYKRRRLQLLKLDSLHRKTFSSLSAFGFCFGNILLELQANAAFGIGEEVVRDGIAFMLESGSANNPDIFRYLDKQRRAGAINVNTVATEVDKRSCRAIQAADLYAFYSRRQMNKFSRFKGRLSFVPDIHKIHVQPRILHDTAFVEEPFIEGTNLRTGEKFSFTGVVERP